MRDRRQQKKNVGGDCRGKKREKKTIIKAKDFFFNFFFKFSPKNLIEFSQLN